MDNDRWKTDLGRTLMAVFAVAVMVIAAFAMIQPDSSEASGAVDGKTFYYGQLSSDYAREIYNKMADAEFSVDGGEIVATVTIHLTVGEDVSIVNSYQDGYSEVMDILSYEKVIYYWAGSSSFVTEEVFSSGGKIVGKDSGGNILDPRVVIKIKSDVTQYGTTTAEVNNAYSQIQSAMSAIVLEKTDTRMDTVKSIHKAVCNLLTYDDEKPDNRYCRNIATAFIGSKEVVCEGYAKAFKALCDLYNIPCIIVIGTGVTGSGSEGHMWNYVQMENDKWYLVDCTWDDQSTLRENYLLAGSESEGFNGRTIAQDHILNSELASKWNIPTLNTTSFSECKVTLKNYNGDKITEINASVGDKCSLSSLSKYAPSREKTDTKVYTFAGWDLDGVTVIDKDKEYTLTGDVTLTARFDTSDRIYIVTFKNWDGSLVKAKEFHYDDEIIPPADPSREETEYYRFTFSEWIGFTPGTNVTEDGLEYTASYTKSVNVHTEGANTHVICEYSYVKIEAAELTEAQTATGTFTVSFPKGDVTFDKTALDALVAGETLAITTVDEKTIDKGVREKLSNAVIYEIDYGTNNNVFTAGKATVAFNYDLKAWQKAEDLEIFFISGTEMTHIDSKWDSEKKQITFETNHFSTYAVNREADDLTKVIDFLYEYKVIIAIVLITFLLFAIVYKFS